MCLHTYLYLFPRAMPFESQLNYFGASVWAPVTVDFDLISSNPCQWQRWEWIKIRCDPCCASPVPENKIEQSTSHPFSIRFLLKPSSFFWLSLSHKPRAFYLSSKAHHWQGTKTKLFFFFYLFPRQNSCWSVLTEEKIQRKVFSGFSVSFSLKWAIFVRLAVPPDHCQQNGNGSQLSKTWSLHGWNNNVWLQLCWFSNAFWVSGFHIWGVLIDRNCLNSSTYPTYVKKRKWVSYTCDN